MAKTKDAGSKHDDMSFEESMQCLEKVVEALEDGRLSLDESLRRYEEGVQHVRHCHRLIERSERRVALLTGVDAEGNPVTEPFTDDHDELEAKAAARSQRRTSKGTSRKGPTSEGSELF